MPRFLSAEWLAAISGPEPEPAADDVRIHQVVTGGPDGDVEYLVIVRAGATPTIVAGRPARPAHLRITQDYATAAAIHGGELAIADALAAGRIRMAGDTARLVAGAAVLTAAHDQVMARRRQVEGE